MTLKAFWLGEALDLRDQLWLAPQPVMADVRPTRQVREATCYEIYLFHSDSELESADSLVWFQSDDEAAIDLKRNNSRSDRVSEQEIDDSNNESVESGSYLKLSWGEKKSESSDSWSSVLEPGDVSFMTRVAASQKWPARGRDHATRAKMRRGCSRGRGFDRGRGLGGGYSWWSMDTSCGLSCFMILL